MRSKSIVLLALALGCGLVASIGISQVMDKHSPEAVVAEMEPIFVAASDLNYNELLTKDKVRLEEWPKAKVPPGAITKLEEIEGHHCATRMFSGEPILTGRVIGSEASGSATGKIPKGFRVVSVRVDAVTGASGLLLPNDRVDVLVYLARNPSTGVQETSTKTILQDVRVFAVDTQFERRHGQEEPTVAAKTISLLVTPAQAEKVTLATEMGVIRLIMRAPDDSIESLAGGASVQDIFGESERGNREHEDPRPARPSHEALAALQPTPAVAPEVVPVAPTPTPTAAPEPTHWKMTLLEGGELRQVELNDNDAFPNLTTAEEGQDDDFSSAPEASGNSSKAGSTAPESEEPAVN